MGIHPPLHIHPCKHTKSTNAILPACMNACRSLPCAEQSGAFTVFSNRSLVRPERTIRLSSLHISITVEENRHTNRWAGRILACADMCHRDGSAGLCMYLGTSHQRLYRAPRRAPHRTSSSHLAQSHVSPSLAQPETTHRRRRRRGCEEKEAPRVKIAIQ
ncbi:hypothetical protein BS50DRAFT_1488 [Corynespora cassiicola Philippines]|uniref:Uncharacterized protein n=1 Tax=Corynespora cassiicola Philippines TaxID=1448308 RepID=A0A2T2P859_CORCC|nr:hypothetical protein BS50DRAFT_1488 [Corynespora cassiicola Philippines]